MTKAKLRKNLLDQRKNLDELFVQEASIRAQHHLMADDVWKKAQQVIIYSPIRNEVRTDLLLNDI